MARWTLGPAGRLGRVPQPTFQDSRNRGTQAVSTSVGYVYGDGITEKEVGGICRVRRRRQFQRRENAETSLPAGRIAARVWEMLEHTMPLSEISARLAQEFGITPQAAHEYTLTLVDVFGCAQSVSAGTTQRRR